MSGTKKWIVTMSGNRPFNDIQKDVAKSGFNVDQILAEIGCITGSASEDVARKLRSIPGVTDVSPDEEINIGPPDAPVTW